MMMMMMTDISFNAMFYNVNEVVVGIDLICRLLIMLVLLLICGLMDGYRA